MKTQLKCIIAILLLLEVVASKAELTNSMFDIRHIGYAEGLSNQRVFSIVQDEDGAMWIATKAGIDRYNSSVVKSYALPGKFYYGDMAGRTLRLLYDKKQGLWAYDNTGKIYRYSVELDSFEQYLSLSDFIHEEIILNKLCLDNDGTLWLGLGNGLYKKESRGNVTLVLPKQYVNDIVFADQSLFVGTSSGVLKLSRRLLEKEQWLIQGKNVLTLFHDISKKELWVGTFNNGLWIMNLETSALTPLKGQSSNLLNPVRAITPYDNHSLLIGLDGGGVYAVDRHTKESHLLMSTEDSSDIFLRGNGIYAVTKDSQGNIWIGSYTGGISVAILSKYPITVLNHQRGNPHSLANNNVNDIKEDTSGNLWFATDFGISIKDVSSRNWSHILKGVVVVTFCRGEDGSVWAGTYGDGIYQVNKQKQIVKHLTKQDGGLTTNNIFSIVRDSDGDLWVGGLDGQLMMMDKQGHFKQLYDVKWVHSITLAGDGRIAAATVNGFCLIDKYTGDIQHYATSQEYHEQDASAYIISMLFNKDGTVWLGTEGGGLNLYNLKTRQVKIFTTREGLPSNDIYSLQRDTRGRLWVSTGKGLALIENSHVSNLNYVVDIDKEYNKSSFTKLSDGRFAYGSTNGVVIVQPNAITVTNYQAQLRFTGFTIEYLSPNEGERLRPLIYEMLSKGTIDLDYKHNSFAVTFESINYRFQRDIAYQYILEGYDKSWSSLSSIGMVRYTNVSPGSYLLKVRSLRRNNGEVISEQTLIVKVAQPWWYSWWAWMFYISIGGIIFYFILRYNRNRLQKEYDEDKIRFFVDTAHDIRTPVTLIMAPLDDLCKEKGLSGRVSYLLELARNNTHKLNTLITQLLEFEKVDTHRQQLILNPLNINDILAEEITNFQAFCDKKQIQLNLSLPEENIYIMADRHMISILLDNLLSNACKYTMPQGEVNLSLNCTKRRVFIEVRDNGIGIPEKAKRHLFSDVYRADNARMSHEGGTGFGLLQVHRIVKMLHGKISFQSEENKGSSFVVTLRRTFDQQPLSEQPLPEEPLISREPLSVEPSNIGEESDMPTVSRQTSKETLLIVEDHEALRYYLRQTFENDYRVVDVSDGEKALLYLSTEYPDLILSDVMMPGIQGDELCRLVKDNPDTSGIPFILLTAKVNHDATVDGLKKGADDYIAKPFNTEILKLKVQNLIDNRKRQRDYFMRQAVIEVETNNVNAKDLSMMDKSDTNPDKSEEILENSLSESDRQFIIQATRLVIENMSDIHFNINILCQEMAMSRTLFYSRLKSLTGKGPQEFIRIIRLQKAAELLKEGRNVTEVSTETGFINTKYFSSLFKKHFGVQPSRYGQSEVDS